MCKNASIFYEKSNKNSCVLTEFCIFAIICRMSPFLSRIAIANYKSILYPQAINFDTTSMNVAALYGRNAAGKSNILKAVKTIADMIIHSGDASFILPYDSFHYSREAALRPTMFCIDVKNEKYSLSYVFSYNADRIIHEMLRMKSRNTNKYKILFLRRENTLINVSAVNYGFGQKLIGRTLPKTLLLTKAYEDNNPYASFILDAVKNIEFTSMESSRLESKVATILSDSPRIKDKVVKVMRNIDPGFKDIQTSNTRMLENLLRNAPINTDLLWRLTRERYVNVKIARKYKKNEYLEDISDESSGTRAILSALTMLQYAADNDLMLCVDEFGSYMHPQIAQRIISYYDSLNPKKKMLITTHQLGLYDYIGRSERIIVRKDEENGATYTEQRKSTKSVRKAREEKREAKNYFRNASKKETFDKDAQKLFDSLEVIGSAAGLRKPL